MRKFFTHTDHVVPVHHPRVLVETAVEQGVCRQALLENTGILPGMLAHPETRLSYIQYGALISNALRLTGNPALGLDVGRNTGFPQMGVVGLAIMTSPTVGAALDAAIRYNRLLNPCFTWALRFEGERAILSFREVIPITPFRVFAIEMMLTAFDRQGRELSGGQLPIRALRIAHSRPAHADRYREFCEAPMYFDQSESEAEFDRSLLDKEVLFADPATGKLTEQLCAELASLEAPADGLISQVRSLLGSARGRPPDLEELARTLQTSSRSLRRALSDMGVSYLELLDESRQLRAEEWVRATSMTFDQIAERLGFSNVRSFRRAFKRWTSHTPGEYREKNGEQSPRSIMEAEPVLEAASDK